MAKKSAAAATAKKSEPASANKRTAKKKKKAKREPKDLSVTSSRALGAITDVLRDESGFKGAYVAGRAGSAVLGIPMPSFCLEYLLQVNVWPLNRIVQVVGEKGSCKSVFTFEVCRWFRNQAGIGFLNENESKYSPTLALSVLGYPTKPDEEAMSVIVCDSVESWQTALSKEVKWVKTAQHKTGKLFPVLLIVDSVMGSLSKETSKAIEKAGYSDRAFAVEALKITQYLKDFPRKLTTNPMSLILVNHLKLSKIDMYRTERSIAGGKHLGFQETFELEFTNTAKYNPRAVQHSKGKKSLNIKIRCWKNSLGETGTELRVPFWWTFKVNPKTGRKRQYSTWDWPAATANLILEQSKDPKVKKDLDDIIGMRKVRHGRAMVYVSKPLGVSKTDALDLSGFGKAIDSSPTALEQLRDYFGIHEFQHYQPGVDFDKQVGEVKREAERLMREQDKELKTSDEEFEDEEIDDIEEEIDEAIEDEED